MKKRKLTLLISIFAVLAMISVGFAAWVITNNAEAEDQGNVRVYIQPLYRDIQGGRYFWQVFLPEALRAQSYARYFN